MQAYIHELGQCLLQLDGDKVGYVAERMMTLSVEGMRLIGRRLLCNPAAHKALITGSLAQGEHTLLRLDGRFYTKLLVSQLSGLTAHGVLHPQCIAVVRAVGVAVQIDVLHGVALLGALCPEP
jgi:hypothetical protein